MAGFIEDFLFGFRLVRRSPVVSALAIVCLAMGIGLSTAMFSLTYSIVGRGLPFENQDKIFLIERRALDQSGGGRGTPISVDDVRYIFENQSSFAHLSAVNGDNVSVGFTNLPQLRSGGYVTPDFFSVMPVKPLLGRVFNEEDGMPTSPKVLLLNEVVWKNQFASDPEIIGKSCICDGQHYTIIGVLPRDYDYPFSAEVWMPLVPETLRDQTGWIDTATLIGLLQEDVTRQQAQAEMEMLFKQVDETKSLGDTQTTRPYLMPFLEIFVNPELSVMMWSMFGATFFVLLIACSNVASLLTARMASRSNEIAVRSALGANRRRIVTQILGETMVWAVLGTALGLFVSWRVLGVLWNLVSAQLFSPPSFMEFRLDPLAVVVAIVMMILSVILSGLLPALRASKSNIGILLNDSLRTGSSLRLSRFSSASTIMQLAVSLALLVAAGRLIVGIVQANSAEYPFDDRGLIVGSVVESQAYPELDDKVRFWNELHEALKSIPGVSSVAFGFNLPAIFGMTDMIGIEGVEYPTEDDYPQVRFDVVSPGYFETLGVELLGGRDFLDTDVAGSEPVAIVNTTMAERFWPNENPIGKFFSVQGRPTVRTEEERLHRVIAVAPDLAMDGLFNDEDDGSGYYRSQAQALWGDQKIIARSERASGALIMEMQETIALFDPNIPITNAKSFSGHISDSFFFFRFFMWLFSSFGAAALALSAAGIYGIIQFAVSLRVTEFGIRMALGATSRRIFWMILGRGLRNAAIGLFIGILLSFTVNRVLLGVFAGLDAEHYSLVLSVAVLILVAVISNVIPARQSARLDPMTALRVR